MIKRLKLSEVKFEMAYVYKPAGGALLGVTIPLVTEYAVKGARLGATTAEPTKGLKWSGILGVAEGVVGIGGAFAAEKGVWKGVKDEDKALLAAFGGGGLATGLGILILDELRKRTLYAFKKEKGVPSRVPLAPGEEGLEEVPPEELIKEI
jgi:hypothetical protein